MSDFKCIDGGVTSASGFTAGGVACGIKKKGKDLAVLASDRDCRVGGVFTQNRVIGTTVTLCRERLKGGVGRALVVNSGNANACTGPQGAADAETMAQLVADALAVPVETVFVCSTGTIGIPLPMDRVSAGIPDAVSQLQADGGSAAAEAIMTTDTVPKEAAVQVEIDGRTVTIGGMAKGSGMIEPNMATMLAFLTTDATVDAAALQQCLTVAVNASFNRISVDGDQSCNDTVLLFANGAAGNDVLSPEHPEWDVFMAGLQAVALDLAKQIVKDGEGATKFVTITVSGAANDHDAQAVARAVGNSLLVKTALFGEDPNWGRVIDAVGYSGAAVEQDRITIAFDDVAACRDGVTVPDALPKLKQVIKQPAFSIGIDLGIGDGNGLLYTCDCSYDYVRINADYMT